MTQTCSTPYQSKNFGMDNPSQQGLTWASQVWRYWYLQQSTQISRTSFQQANIKAMHFGNKNKTLFPYENMGFHPPVHRAALWCHVCFWETVLHNWTWVGLQKLGNEFAGPRQRDFLCFQTYIQIVLENLVLESGPRVHDHNVTKPKSAEQDGKCALLTNRRQKKLGYVSHWHDGGLGIAVLKKKRPALSCHLKHSLWPLSCTQRMLFCLSHFFKKGLIDGFYQDRTSMWTYQNYEHSPKKNWSTANWNAICFIEQIFHHCPSLKTEPVFIANHLVCTNWTKCLRRKIAGWNPNEVKLLELSISAGLATMLRNTCCTHSLRRPVASTPGPSLAASFSCENQTRRATNTCSWLKLKIK